MAKTIKRKHNGRYSNVIRRQCITDYAVQGSIKLVAKGHGNIPYETIRTWVRSDEGVQLITDLHALKSTEHRANYSKIIDKAQAVTLAKLDDCSAAQANLIACQGTDKVRLSDNMPTHISTTLDSSKAQIDFLEGIARSFKLQSARVISIQDENDK